MVQLHNQPDHHQDNNPGFRCGTQCNILPVVSFVLYTKPERTQSDADFNGSV